MTKDMSYRLAVDIGGTFTDLVLLDEASGALHGHKILTTPRAPEEAALRGLRELCARARITPAQITTLIHATTLVTNALIERKGAATALLTTAGFRDTLEMGKEQRYDIYDLFLKYPDPLVPRRWRVGVRERITRDGEVRVPLDVPAVRRTEGRLLESGPAAGALLAGHIGSLIGQPDLVGFDMGGTTAKICLVRDGRPKVTPTIEVARVHRFKPGSGLPVKTPVVDMIEIGAGGGSLAGVDSMGLLRVGPQSAGADPGPACYGLGGTAATVTDACVVLGYYDPAAFLGGAMPLDAGAAREAVSRVGVPLGLNTVETAWGIFAIVCESMAQAARLYLIERGQDPRRFALVGFGGAGPAAAARVARLLGMRQAIIPPASGLASALGLLVAPAGFDFGHSLTGELQSLNWDEVERLFVQMEDRGREMVLATGMPASSVRAERRAEMRYKGQFHDIEVPLPTRLHHGVVPAIRERFDAEYARLFGLALDGYPVQVLNWRVLVSAPGAKVDLRGSSDGATSPEQALKRRRSTYLPDGRSFVDVPVYARAHLTEHSIDGPAVIEEAEATTLLWPGDRLTVDGQRNLVIEIGQSTQPTQTTQPTQSQTTAKRISR